MMLWFITSPEPQIVSKINDLADYKILAGYSVLLGVPSLPGGVGLDSNFLLIFSAGHTFYPLNSPWSPLGEAEHFV